jgi:hypothetical protein
VQAHAYAYGGSVVQDIGYYPLGSHVFSEWYGPAVPCDVDLKAHLKTEFGFDVLQVAKGRYAPEDYRPGYWDATPSCGNTRITAKWCVTMVAW